MLNKETEYVLNTFGVDIPELLTDLPEGQEVVIVDTNNADELPEKLADVAIVNIIDHHKLSGNISTASPLEIIMKPLASTASVLYDTCLTDVELPTYIAQLISACIVSDTLLFRSPTTTERDREILTLLSEEHTINIDELADSMFAAKSDISHLTADEIITYDAKQYPIGGSNLLISVLETTSPEKVLEHKKSIQEAMRTKAEKDALEAVLFYVVDILNEEAIVISYDDASRSWSEKAFDAHFENDQATLKGIVSRKKQIIPRLEEIS